MTYPYTLTMIIMNGVVFLGNMKTSRYVPFASGAMRISTVYRERRKLPISLVRCESDPRYPETSPGIRVPLSI